ncbi:MAG: transposase [Gammaproteobacteria bacterium]|nr:transposase [Gammaproteobacteria bacterium]
MPRTARASVGGICYHVINRGNRRAIVFHGAPEYRAFTTLMKRACDRLPMRVVGYCLMPNHFHLVLWPYGDGDLSRWMQWLLTSHVRRFHKINGTDGRVWQGRFKAFPIEQDEHLLTVLRYVERNPLRAGLVQRAEQWPWSSIEWRGASKTQLHMPVPLPNDWLEFVNCPQTPAELESLRRCVNRGRPFGSSSWQARIAAELGLEDSLRPIGRPPKP